ncbi:hypothetical protein BJ508DRAFT_363903 [Ascobolus immersus RN42]|uniref:F-box domain-containing protein n=1 Tax=Ascobolus immersus RN42 TaxID=1160509 RepID=A0A3N4HXG2_ASCIM|nr:hypothetical protein BJ508DRAFT_363903 [Ascobolus immersus RN42]
MRERLESREPNISEIHCNAPNDSVPAQATSKLHIINLPAELRIQIYQLLPLLNLIQLSHTSSLLYHDINSTFKTYHTFRSSCSWYYLVSEDDALPGHPILDNEWLLPWQTPPGTDGQERRNICVPMLFELPGDELYEEFMRLYAKGHPFKSKPADEDEGRKSGFWPCRGCKLMFEGEVFCCWWSIFRRS